MKKVIKNNKGFAIVSVLVLSFISLALISIVFTVLFYTTQATGREKQYLVQLETAKGVSEYIMGSIRNEDFTCGGNKCTSTNDDIDLHGSICTAFGKPTSCDGITATFLSEVTYTPVGGGNDVTIIGVEVRSESGSSQNETAIVEFLYKIF